MTRTRSIYLALLAVLLSPMAANADVITFNGTAPESSFEILLSGASYSESGYTVTAQSEGIFFLDNDYASDINGFDDDVMDLDAAGSMVLITADGGGLFDAIDVLLAQLNIPGSLQFTGFFGGGGSIVANATGCGLGCIDLFSFSGFVGLTSLQITNTGPYMVFDDLQLTATSVPEPGTLALLGLGLVGLAVRRRKKV